MANQYRTTQDVFSATDWASLQLPDRGRATNGSSYFAWSMNASRVSIFIPIADKNDYDFSAFWSNDRTQLEWKTEGGLDLMVSKSGTNVQISLDPYPTTGIQLDRLVAWAHPTGASAPVVQALYQQYIVADQKRGIDPSPYNVLPMRRRNASVLAVSDFSPLSDGPYTRSRSTLLHSGASTSGPPQAHPSTADRS